ncbi:hypothetical protein PHYPSEUDO_007099 [Phytophthora pseudosyringae]|uniref:Uncharacterized protein n=1 Tax=Phytophthora pseudosyringae TaxID=221518 RepID=A0A8T1WAK3_9STRA|nr:hypothetical protein PHYPSEUDO_007099 [Phytophthora pseudosyringae]
MRRRPREVPVTKPSAVQSYVYSSNEMSYSDLILATCINPLALSSGNNSRPKVLLRPEEREGQRRWLPNERKPGASKHSAPHQQQDVMKIKVDMDKYCSEAEVDTLNALEEEMEKFVEEFYVAAAMFSTQASAQKAYVETIVSPFLIISRTADLLQLHASSPSSVLDRLQRAEPGSRPTPNRATEIAACSLLD